MGNEFTMFQGACGKRGESLTSLKNCSDDVLAQVDPLLLNLAVARAIPMMCRLDIASYQQQAETWGVELRKFLREAEEQFYRSPGEWKHDLAFFRLGVMCWYVDEILGVRYREDQRDLIEVAYTDPNDLFLTGVMDTRQGTCGSMATLHVALAWRLGWPVSLACAGWHVFCRYDNGVLQHNIEATNNGQGGFHSHPDTYYRVRYNVPDGAIKSGSDLASLRPRQLLGWFVALRGRHWEDVGEMRRAQSDYGSALGLFPESWLLQRKFAETCDISPCVRSLPPLRGEITD
jgi:hypothetical protein